MELSTSKRKTLLQPRPLNELLPSLPGLFTEDGQQALTERKQPRPVKPQPLTADKVMKPMTFSQMSANLLALKPKSPKVNHVPTSHKKGWVSSIKVDYKTISHTANGQLKNHSVRKVLNFQQPKAKAPSTKVSRPTQQPTETPKFPKPDFRPKKSVYAQARINAVRISGICKIPDTPVETQAKPIKSRVTIANKENNPYQPKQNNYRPQPKNNVKLTLPTPILKKLVTKINPSTPENSSWKSNDASFIQKEQEIEQLQLTQAKRQVLTEKPITLTPSSTPFKDYRSVQEYFNNSNLEVSTAYSDNTIMCFEKQSDSKQNSKKEESLITSLCDLFTKATVNTDMDKVDEDLDGLLEIKQQAESQIKMIESAIQMLNTIKKSHIEHLQRVDKLINDRKNSRMELESEKESDKTLVGKELNKTLLTKEDPTIMETSPIVSRPDSVIRSHLTKSPIYKIPTRNMSTLRKKLAYKSMPNVSVCLQTPVKDFEGPALNVYMQMKQQMNFLSTPMVNRMDIEPDTPTLTSHNLQKQLDKLYNGS